MKPPVWLDMVIGTVRLAARGAVGKTRRTGGSDSARYCYSVWLRHLVKAYQAGFDVQPRTVLELGPGDSIGVGIAALLCGADSYVALDQRAFARRTMDPRIFDQLVELLRTRAAIPGPAEFPEVRPLLEAYDFPSDVLDGRRLEASLAPSRVTELRKSIVHGGGAIRYVAPWTDEAVVDQSSIDAIVSQAVLEHVGNLPMAYGAMAGWLRPAGWMSHQVDFRSHNTSLLWNGHWRYSRRQWALVAGRPPLINRHPLSTHIDQLKRAGFVARVIGESRAVEFDRGHVSRDWSGMDAGDFHTAGAHLLAELKGERDPLMPDEQVHVVAALAEGVL